MTASSNATTAATTATTAATTAATAAAAAAAIATAATTAATTATTLTKHKTFVKIHQNLANASRNGRPDLTKRKTLGKKNRIWRMFHVF